MLSVRATGDELMDADDLDPPTYTAVLRDLARVNTLTLARRPTLGFLAKVAERQPGVRLRVLDVGFGNGDMLRAIARWGAAKGVALDLVGVDLNPRSAPAAAAATPSDLGIDYRTGDYADFAHERWDVVVSSLVAHHMTHAQLVAFLRFMDGHARTGWFINDLHRRLLAQVGFRLLAVAMRAHPIVRHDGALSVARSFRPDEWHTVLAEAGVEDAHVQQVFPYRLCVACLR